MSVSPLSPYFASARRLGRLPCAQRRHDVPGVQLEFSLRWYIAKKRPCGRRGRDLDSHLLRHVKENNYAYH
jgi:hypothetical protein